MRIGFYKKPQGVFTEEKITLLQKEITNYFNCEVVEVDFRNGHTIDGRVYVGDICLNDLDVYFWHDTLFPREWGSDNYFYHLLETLEKDVVVINSGKSTRITNDKFLAHTVLKKSNIPVGSFALVNSSDREGIKKIFNSFEHDVLLKPRFGGWGLGIVRSQDFDDLMSSIEYMMSFSQNNQPVLIEKFHQNDISKWISLVVFGKKVLFGYQKPLFSEGAQWKIYDPLKADGRGQKTLYIKPTKELEELALKASEAIGKDIIGFDFISTEDGYLIIDENSRPGLYAHCLEEADIDINKEIIFLIENKLR